MLKLKKDQQSTYIHPYKPTQQLNQLKQTLSNQQLQAFYMQSLNLFQTNYKQIKCKLVNKKVRKEASKYAFPLLGNQKKQCFLAKKRNILIINVQQNLTTQCTQENS
ncbi:hypothetical protein ABPG74_000444 [Tetrahymena malaccensis]